jgi:hypothetical protein
MKIKQEVVHRVCRMILEKLKEKKLIKLKVSEDKVYEALVETFSSNLQEEADIDAKAQEIFESNIGSDETVDRHKMLLMIKRKIAKDRGFIL